MYSPTDIGPHIALASQISDLRFEISYHFSRVKFLLVNSAVLRNEILAERRQGCLYARDSGCQNSGSPSDRRTGGADLQRWRRSGRFCVASARQNAGRAATNLPSESIPGSIHSFGNDPTVRETVGTTPFQKAGPKAGTSWRATSDATADRFPQGAPCRGLSVLQRAAETLQRNSHAVCRRHPVAGSAAASSHGTHHSSGLVSDLPEAGGTEGPRRVARSQPRQPRAGLGRLVALCTGEYAVPDHRCLQLSSATENLCWRIGTDVLPPAGNLVRLVRANSAAGVELGGASCRRERLACEWQNPLVVVLCDARFDLLHDRPLPRSSCADEVLYPGIRRNPGQRFLGRVQRGSVRAASNLFGSFAARSGVCRAVQASGTGLVAVRKKVAENGARRDPAVASSGENDIGSMPFASRSLAR